MLRRRTCTQLVIVVHSGPAVALHAVDEADQLLPRGDVLLRDRPVLVMYDRLGVDLTSMEGVPDARIHAARALLHPMEVVHQQGEWARQDSLNAVDNPPQRRIFIAIAALNLARQLDHGRNGMDVNLADHLVKVGVTERGRLLGYMHSRARLIVAMQSASLSTVKLPGDGVSRLLINLRGCD